VKALILSAALVALCLALQPAAETDPVVHVLLQLPLLALAGGIAARRIDLPAGYAAAALIVALVAIAFWMLPRSIDAALTDWRMGAVKFVSVPLLIGAPLSACWRHLHPVLRGFLKAQAISMLCVLGFLYTHAPLRICNAYLVNDQERLGVGFLIVAAALAIVWSIPVLFGAPSPSTEKPARWQTA